MGRIVLSIIVSERVYVCVVIHFLREPTHLNVCLKMLFTDSVYVSLPDVLFE